MTPQQVPYIILLAEDDPDDRLLFEDALEESEYNADLKFVNDGEELLEYLDLSAAQSGDAPPRPCLIVLDLNMPRMDGREALKSIKENPDFRRIPVVAFTTSREEEDITTTYNLGVNSFIRKPTTFNELVDVVGLLSQYWFNACELPMNGDN